VNAARSTKDSRRKDDDMAIDLVSITIRGIDEPWEADD
jgi:hypothetical protein